MRSLLATILLTSVVGAAAAPAGAQAGPVVAPRSDQQTGPTVSPRIIGGYVPPSGMWPWMAAVQRSPAASPGLNDYQRQWCGGALIHPRIVATAAHCIDGDDPRDWRVLLGRHDLLAAGGEAIDVGRVWIHPRYSQADKTFRNDLALLVLTRPASATPAPLLPTGSTLREGDHATVMGWGFTSVGGALSQYLRAANVPLRSTAGCLADYATFDWRVDPDTTICAGFPQGGNNTCKGDSGGPLMMRDAAGRWYLVGINSWADSCALAGRPTVFTFVGAAHLRDWLARAVAQVNAASAPATTTTPGTPPQPPADPQPASSAPRLAAWLVSARLKRRFRATLRYTASEEGRLTMRIVRRSGGRWKAATATAVMATRPGANQRMVKARLRPGQHKLLLQLTGGGGRRSQLYAIGFRVRR